MKKYGIIYCAYNKINNKRYIGQTIQRLCERKAAHYSKDKEIYFHRALHKYEYNDWEWSEIDTAESKQELDEKEQYWIEYYETCNPKKGYNIQKGGDSDKQTLEQIRYARNKFVEEYGNGVQHNKRNIKNIRCIETGEIFKNAAEAARQKNITHSHIVECANNNKNTAGGYHWEWCIDISLYENAIYCVQLEKTFLSYYEAQRLNRFASTGLGRAFKKQGSPFVYAGYTFYKINDESFLNFSTAK